jgi:anti-anti-sigma factor
MTILLEISGEVGRIVLTGIFDYSVQDGFRQVTDKILDNKNIKHITVDMAEVTFMDSSGIRLLLLLNKKAMADRKSLTLINCRAPLREIFSIGGFDAVLKIR